MNIIKQIWKKLNNPLIIGLYSIGCIFMLLVVFNLKDFNHSLAVSILKVATLVFSIFVYGRAISMIAKFIQKKY